MAEPYTKDEVFQLAHVIADAKLKGVLAGSATLARMILDAGYRHVDTGDAHVIELRDTGWTLSHPLACRPRLFECEVNRIAEVELDEPPEGRGRFRCDVVDGRFVLGERVTTDG